MGDFKVFQRTSDGMFNATELLKQWNEASGQQKQIVHYSENSTTQQFIQALMLEENFKERNSVVTKSRGKYNGGTWMHPLLFIDFAMWLNPAFKVKVLKFVYDELIRYRNDAGDAYIEMSSAVARITPKHFSQEAIKNVARAINYVIYGNHEKGMRDKQGDENLARDLYEQERDIAKLINLGFVKSYDSLMDDLRKQWAKKWQPKVLQP